MWTFLEINLLVKGQIQKYNVVVGFSAKIRDDKDQLNYNGLYWVFFGYSVQK